jgi:hypothetical protein
MIIVFSSSVDFWAELDEAGWRLHRNSLHGFLFFLQFLMSLKYLKLGRGGSCLESQPLRKWRQEFLQFKTSLEKVS